MMMIAALMLVAVSSAFAGASDALKAIKKASTYSEAAQLVQSSLDQLADNAEKAEAYNTVVDLALKTFNAESVKAQAQQQANEEDMYNALQTAFTAANECYKYDQLPNAKGKVKERFSKANALRLYNLRPYLINGGGFFQGKDYKKAFDLLSGYVASNDYPVFAELKQDPAKDPNYKNAAFYASYMALMDKDYPNAEKYSEMAIGDSANGSNALAIMFQAMKSQVKTKADTLAFVQKCKDLYTKYPDNQVVFANLVNAYSQVGQDAEAEKLVDERLASNPNDFYALYDKGLVLFQKNQYEDAANTMMKALSFAPEASKLDINATIGDCYLGHAQARLDKIKGVLSKAAKDQFIPVYNNAIKYYEAAKALDKDGSQKSKYAARLYSCYYFVYGEADPKTQEAKTYAGY